MNFKKKAGFTLLELLVVISIIGILTAIGMAAFSQAQKKGRDARRFGDMKSFQNALEQYYTANNSAYPTGSCSSFTIASGEVFYAPQDPKGTYVCNIQASSYYICALLDDPTKANADGTGNFGAGTKTHFCVKNLQ